MIRLDKLLAQLGYGSRKHVKEMIRNGRIIVNNTIIFDDDIKVSHSDKIVVDGEEVEYIKDVYYMLNKPEGVISSSFAKVHQTVLELINDPTPFLSPLGRLDMETQGLIIITNNSKLLAQKKAIVKKYYVEYEGDMPSDYHLLFPRGIVLENGIECLPARYEPIDEKSGYISIIDEKYHQVKRMFASLNLKVTCLKRIAFGPIVLDNNLKSGEFRLLTKKEIALLKDKKR